MSDARNEWCSSSQASISDSQVMFLVAYLSTPLVSKDCSAYVSSSICLVHSIMGPLLDFSRTTFTC